MLQAFESLFPILFGFLICIFRRQFAQKVMEFQNEMWGFNFGDKEIRITTIIAVIAGMGMIYIGVSKLMHLLARAG